MLIKTSSNDSQDFPNDAFERAELNSRHVYTEKRRQLQYTYKGMYGLSPGLGCSKTSTWEIILSVQVLVASARARSSSSPGSNSVLSAWPRLSPVYWSGTTASLNHSSLQLDATHFF